MKSRYFAFNMSVLLTVCVLSASCSSTRPVAGQGKLPPGQAKKITGAKSAKTYAPGQQKKR